MSIRVGILIYDQVEVLDFAGPYEVFTTASRLQARVHPEEPPLFEVFVIGGHANPIRARGDLRILPRYDLATHPPVDVLVIPGGVVDEQLLRPELAAWIRDTAGRANLTASVCTGAFLLAQAGLLAGRRVTTHWEDAEELAARFPGVRVDPDARWIDEGSVITAAGISAGLDMSLHLVGRLATMALARQTARQMDYAWRTEGGIPGSS